MFLKWLNTIAFIESWRWQIILRSVLIYLAKCCTLDLFQLTNLYSTFTTLIKYTDHCSVSKNQINLNRVKAVFSSKIKQAGNKHSKNSPVLTASNLWSFVLVLWWKLEVNFILFFFYLQGKGFGGFIDVSYVNVFIYLYVYAFKLHVYVFSR